MSAWTDGECPPGDPTTVGQRLQQILDWIDEELTWVTPVEHPGLHAALTECRNEALRVRDRITVYDPVNADKLFVAFGRAQTAFNLPRADPAGKEVEWRGAKDTIKEIHEI